jgi:hypothetical protein
VQPVREELHGAARVEQVRRGRCEFGGQAVGFAAAVPVGPARSRRADDERRVRDHQVEAAARDGRQQVALQQFEVHAVDDGVECGEGDRALAQVGGGHALGVIREAERLHAAAGAQVERAADRGAQRRVHEQL